MNSSDVLWNAGQRLADPEVREDDARGAVAALLAVEDQADRDALLDADEVGRVAALDGDLDLLDAAAQLGPARLLRAEEEPRQGDDERDAFPAVIATSDAGMAITSFISSSAALSNKARSCLYLEPASLGRH